MTKLIYKGAGSWLPDVPARDLTDAEAEYFGIGRLLDSGLYKLFEEPQSEESKGKKSKRLETAKADGSLSNDRRT